jgi:hypothetical protein
VTAKTRAAMQRALLPIGLVGLDAEPDGEALPASWRA